jgi:hypothetical protein
MLCSCITDRLAYHIGDLVVLTKIAPINLIVMKKVKIVDEANDDVLMRLKDGKIEFLVLSIDY